MESRGKWTEASGGLEGNAAIYWTGACVDSAGWGISTMPEQHRGGGGGIGEQEVFFGCRWEQSAEHPKFAAPPETGKPVPDWVWENVPDWLLPWSVFTG